MTFACRPQSAVAYIVNPLPLDSSYTITGDSEIGFSRLQIIFARNGELQDNVTYEGVQYFGNGQWYVPLTTTIGDSYWVRMTLNSGTDPGKDNPYSSVDDFGTSGTWYALSDTNAHTWRWVQSTVGTTTANVTFDIASDSGGSNIVASKTINVSVSATP
jgi:hypothetical protein